MIERFKTGALILLVALSLLQSYLLAYSMPGIVATVRSDQDYVNPEPLGPTTSVESVIFPEVLVIHLGEDEHTMIYPGTQFYDMILKQRLAGREFRGLQRSPVNIVDWDKVRRNDTGIELRFDNGIAVELLQKLLKLEGDLLFLDEKIDRIWIYKTTETEEIRTFFFSNEGQFVYEAVRADLTVRDIQDYVGFGQFLPKYEMTSDGIYIPVEPIQATELVYPYEVYSPDQMQRSLFFDPSTTRAIKDRNNSQIFTDGKRGLQVKQNGLWISFTNPAATQSSKNLLSENVYASVDFVNWHGGWDGVHRLVNPIPSTGGKEVTFQQYLGQYPIISYSPFLYGYMTLTLEQGVVTEYDRSLITLGAQAESREVRWLPGGDVLKDRLASYTRRDDVTTLYPALKAMPMSDNKLQFVPVWAVRHEDGTEGVLFEAYPVGYDPGLLPANGENDEESEEGTEAESGEESGTGAKAESKNGDSKATSGMKSGEELEAGAETDSAEVREAAANAEPEGGSGADADSEKGDEVE